MAAIFVYSLARGEETEHYKIKQPIRQIVLINVQVSKWVLTLVSYLQGRVVRSWVKITQG